MGESLLDKVWKMHKVATLKSGLDQIFIGLHLIHEVTSPQAFSVLREKNLKVMFPENCAATADHIIPTDILSRPFRDRLAEEMLKALEENTKSSKIRFYGLGSKKHGIVHIIGPELGLTQPGMTIACGDSHTSTHGAFGAIAMGVGTSQIRDILATGCLAASKPKLRRINVSGKLQKGVYAKDVILKIINNLGVKGGIGYAYEYAGNVLDNFSMEERMTVCNMSIEGGARMGYVNPDETTYDYLKGREFAPKNFSKAVKFWDSVKSDRNAGYDDEIKLDGSKIEPIVTYGINPGQSISVNEKIPDDADEEALQYMKFRKGEQIKGKKINVAFIGSCTNSRISDLREAAKIVNGRKVHNGVRALVVPGSEQVRMQAESEGLDEIFKKSGFQWRNAGCSMCLAMNPDKLIGDEVCASTSNRNFKGRQGSPTGRTLLMSPAMVAIAACEGKVADVRDYL
ncbi:3-isopropylmalate dehydratase large subunit [Candidatus Woesearchaeota archaeon]|nr:3-isopropylmalate dehydratase large subunit [Candidatus Woesearchaeota archaeon]